MARILYDFECSTCRHEFEEFKDTNSDALIACPRCGWDNTTKLISGTRIDPKLGVDANSFSTMGDRWARIREQRQKIENKKVRDHGPDA